MALSTAVYEALWFKQILPDLKLDIPKLICVYEDNKSTIALCNTLSNAKHSKHIDTKYKFIKEKIKEGIIAIKYLKSEDLVANICTKSLLLSSFKTHVCKLGVR